MNTELDKTDLDTTEHHAASIARSVAPEDIQPDDYLVVLSQLRELFPFWALCDAPWQKIELIHLQCLPEADAAPVRVVEICLPSLLVRDKDGKHSVVDTRQFRFARLSQRFGRKAFKRLRRLPKSEESSALSG